MNLLGGFNWLDLFLLLLAITSIGLGYQQGLLRQVIGLAALYIAAILGAQYFSVVGAWIRFITFQPNPNRFLNAISFFIIVVVVWLILTWLAFDAYRSVKFKLVPLIDQLGGGIIALVAMLITTSLVLSVVLFSIGETWPGGETVRMMIGAALETSRLVPMFESYKPMLLNTLGPWLPAGLPAIFNLS